MYEQTSSLFQRHSWHDVLPIVVRCLAHPTDIAISQDKPGLNIRVGSGLKQMRLLTIVLPVGTATS
jgi:hypothetical protein